MVTEWLLQCMKLNSKVTSLNDYDLGLFRRIWSHQSIVVLIIIYLPANLHKQADSSNWTFFIFFFLDMLINSIISLI